jgi:hypothetical protein
MQTVVAGSIAPAIIGLVGTVVGASIVGTVNVWLARVTRRNEARATARLVEEELDAAAHVVGQLAKEGGPMSAGHREKLVAAEWEKGRAVLAHSLRRPEWDGIREGYRALDELRVDGGAVSEARLRGLQATIAEAGRQLTALGRDQALGRLFSPARAARARPGRHRAT